MTMFQGAVLVALMSGVTQVRSKCTAPIITNTKLDTSVLKANNARDDGWSGANCGSGQTDVATGTTCTITAHADYVCTDPGECGTNGKFAQDLGTKQCKKKCTVPANDATNKFTLGVASWVGLDNTNGDKKMDDSAHKCATGATNVLEGTKCTITAKDAYVCTDPGLCQADGTFERTAKCQEKAKCDSLYTEANKAKCPSTKVVSNAATKYCTGTTCQENAADKALCCQVTSKCSKQNDGTAASQTTCPAGTETKASAAETSCSVGPCDTSSATAPDTAKCCQVTSTCGQKNNGAIGGPVTCPTNTVYNPSAKGTKCSVGGCSVGSANSEDTGKCCKVESSCSRTQNGVDTGAEANCAQCIGADGVWETCPHTGTKKQNGFKYKESAKHTKCKVAGCPITSATSADMGTCCQKKCPKDKCPAGPGTGVDGQYCEADTCQEEASGILKGVDITNCCQADCPNKCPSSTAWLGSGFKCATNTCQVSGSDKLVGADKTTCCKAKCPKGGCNGLLNAAGKALVDRTTGAYCATAQCDWSSTTGDKNDKTRCCQEKTTVCSPSDTTVLGSACKCATTSTTNECAVAKFCWADNTCNSAAKAACSVVDGSATSTAYPCDCGTASCTTNQKCTSATNSCALAVCSSVAGLESSDYPCTCGTATCTGKQKCTSTSNSCAEAVCSSVAGEVSSVYPCACGTATCTANQKCTKEAVAGVTPANDCTLAACSSWHFKKQCQCGTAICGKNEECFPISNTCALVSGDDTCTHSNDGVCDDPTYCTAGTDCSDCGTCKVVTETTAPAIAGAVTLEVQTSSGFEADAGLKIWAGTDEETLVLAGTTVRGLLRLKTPLQKSYAQGTTVYRIEVSKVDASVRAASAEVDAANAKANSTNSTNNKRAMLFAHRSAEPAFLFAAMVIAIGYAGL